MKESTQFIEEFCAYHRVDRGHSDLTIKVYRNELTFIFRILNDIISEELSKSLKPSKVESALDNFRVGEIQPSHIRKLLVILKDNHNNNKRSISHKISVLRSFYKYLKKYDYVLNNIMEKIDFPKASEIVSEVPTKNDILQLFAHLNNRKYRNEFEKKNFLLYFYLKYKTMARNIEMFRIRVKDINFDTRKILIKGKGDKERLLPLNDRILDMIRDYIILANLSDEDKLIRNRYNKPTSLRSLELRVEEVRKEAGLKEWMTGHPLLRKSPATELWMAGLRLTEVQDLLGHAKPETTRIYVKPLMADIEKKLEKYDPLEFIHDI